MNELLSKKFREFGYATIADTYQQLKLLKAAEKYGRWLKKFQNDPRGTFIKQIEVKKQLERKWLSAEDTEDLQNYKKQNRKVKSLVQKKQNVKERDKRLKISTI